MNLVGKIFVVLIFTGSLIFMAFAVAVYGNSKNWMEAINREASEVTSKKPLGYKHQLKARIAERNRIQAKLDEAERRLELEKAARTQALAKLESEYKRLGGINDELVKQVVQLNEQKRIAIEAFNATELNLAALGKEIGGLREEIRVAQSNRDNEAKNVVRLTDTVHQRLGELDRLNERSRDLVQQLAKYRAAMTILGKTPSQIIAGIPPVDGIVTAVRAKANLVEISLGSDDGLKKKHTLDVFRNNKYLGKVQILRTAADKSVARILKSSVRGKIQKGDRVATKL